MRGPGPLRIGTRGSPLARAQAAWVAARLGGDVETVLVRTEGDARDGTPLIEFERPGVFATALRASLLSGEVDLAVHSLKDLPVEPAEGLVSLAVPAREDPRDLWIPRGGGTWRDAPAGARVGTGSPRRASQMRALRGDLVPVPIRGNVDTRLAKLARGECDALVLACAGILRLGLAPAGAAPLDPAEMLPAPGQGALAVEARAGDEPRLAWARERLHDPGTEICVRTERALLRHVGGGCHQALGALATLASGEVHLKAALEGQGGVRRAQAEGDPADLDRLVARIARDLGR